MARPAGAASSLLRGLAQGSSSPDSCRLGAGEDYKGGRRITRPEGGLQGRYYKAQGSAHDYKGGGRIIREGLQGSASQLPLLAPHTNPGSRADCSGMGTLRAACWPRLEGEGPWIRQNQNGIQFPQTEGWWGAAAKKVLELEQTLEDTTSTQAEAALLQDAAAAARAGPEQNPRPALRGAHS